MAVEARRPNLPIPTDSSTTGGSVTDVATDLSKRTDKTSYSVPDDGSPLVIPTRRRNRDRDRGDDSKLSRGPQNSQTSLLIEYFEGGKGGSGSSSLVSRPSVRVRVTPSSKKLKDQRDHQIQVTESNGGQKPVFSRRISLNSPYRSQKGGGDYEDQEQSFDLEEEYDDGSPRQPQNNPPLEIEFLNNRDQQNGSDLDQDHDNHYIPATSDISSMPADSLLEAPSSATNRRGSQSRELELEAEPEPESKKNNNNNDLLKTPGHKRSRSLSTERIAHKVAEKLSNDPQERKRLEKTVEEDVNKHLHDPDPESRSTRRRARKLLDEEMATPDSSMLGGTSAVSGNQFSARSGVSNNKSSINNPRLLETVEDAIRRLILPELKELKKDQKVIHNTSKFERDLNTSSYSSASGPSRDELGRRLSKHASAPDVMKPKVVLNKNSRDEGTTLLKGGQSSSNGRPMLNKDRNLSKDSGLNSPSEADSSHVKWGSRPDLTGQDMVRRQKSKGLRDAQKAGRVGTALTAAALQRHESKSTLDHSESQPHSDSHSQNERGAPGINETELVFQRHNVAPMPLRSMLDSELTRDSLTSQQTATGPDSGSPLKNRLQQQQRDDAPSPISRTPNRTPLDTRYELGVRPGDQSNQNLSVHSASDRDGRNRSFSPMVEDYDFDDDGLHSNGGDTAAAGDIAAAAVANLLDENSDPSRRRVLSPIQSVASEHSDLKEQHKQHSSPRQSAGQEGKLGFSRGERALEPRLSIGSLSSAPSTNYARSAKPSGLSLNSQRNGDSQQSRGFGYGDSSRTEWDDSSNLGGPKNDDSEIDYMEKVHQGQRVSDGRGNSPQFVHPVPVESAVASLLDPSTVGPRSTQLGGKRSEPNLSRSLDPQTEGERGGGSPLKQRQDANSPDATSFLKRMGVTSPPQSVTQSLDDQAELGHARSFDLGDDAMMPQVDNTPGSGSESEINTNPSIIQGPGLPEEGHQEYWNYDQATPEKRDQSGLEDSSPANRDLGLDDEMSYDAGQYPEGAFAHEDYLDQKYGDDTPSGGKDEGYASGAQPISPSPGTPKANGTRDLDLDGDVGMFDSPGDEPFTPSHQRNLSGYSHGAGSPLYDSATGKGIERIQSKDIIALMDHLTVRDAQRNARDTEILVSLVRSAAEMRTSFEEMKKFIASQDGMMMEANDKHHERTYRALGGPRPQPPSNSRPRQVAFADEEDAKTKRQNVFKRALKGLSLKSGNDLTKIEDMLEQLLDEVEALRDQQDEHFGTSARPSLDQDGYDERDGETANRAQHSSRPSTVPEVDEEENEEYSAEKEFLSPQLPSEENPGAAPVASGALEEMTPPRSNEKSRKPKSGPASFFPKISRWSKATGDNIRNSIQPKNKDRFAFPYDAAASRSGDLPSGPYDYSPQGEDRIRSRVSFDDQHLHQQPQVQDQEEEEGERPPSPLVPSQMSEAPKYHAHRNSLNLQHPQPRQGPTGRYQTQLESQAHVYGYPNSPQADQWGSTSSVNMAQKRNSVASRLSPISDAGYSQATSRHSGPPRPPKVKDDGPLVPERPAKVREDDERSYTTNRHASRSSAMYASASPQNSPPARKLTGPRPLNSGSQYSSRRRRASPEQVDDLDY